MPPRIPNTKRTQILNDIKTTNDSARTIAKRHNVSPSTVSTIAKQAGLEDAFIGRAQTEAATRARQADLRARRARIREALLEDVERLRERAWSEYSYFEKTAGQPVKVTLPLPPLGEVRNAYTSIGIAIDKEVSLARVDASQGVESAVSMLGGLAVALGQAADALGSGSDSPGGDGE